MIKIGEGYQDFYIILTSPSIKRGILSDNCNANHVSWIGIDLGNFYKKKKSWCYQDENAKMNV